MARVVDALEREQTGLNRKWQVRYRRGKKIRHSPKSSGCSVIIAIACTTNSETPTREMVSGIDTQND